MLSLALGLVGCKPRILTPADFAFVTTNTTLEELSREVGQPNRAYIRNPTVFYEWDLGRRSGYAMQFTATLPHLHLTDRVQMKGIVRLPDPVIDFRTNRGAYPEAHSP